MKTFQSAKNVQTEKNTLTFKVKNFSESAETEAK